MLATKPADVRCNDLSQNTGGFGDGYAFGTGGGHGYGRGVDSTGESIMRHWQCKAAYQRMAGQYSVGAGGAAACAFSAMPDRPRFIGT